MIPEIVTGVLIALVLARIFAVLVRRLWADAIAYLLLTTYWPDGKQIPGWFWVASEIATNERWDER